MHGNLTGKAQDDELLLDMPELISHENIGAEIDTDVEMRVDEDGRPKFSPGKNIANNARVETRKVLIPPHRFTPLKTSWPQIVPPLVEHLKLQVRMNLKNRAVELRTSKHTTDAGALQKGADFM